MHRLARFITDADDALLTAAGVVDRPNARERRRLYYDALAPIDAISRPLDRLRREVLRHDEVRAAVAGSGGIPVSAIARLGFGVATGSPFMMLGGAGSLVSRHLARSEDEGVKARSQRESATIAVRVWNHVMRSLVPAIAARILDELDDDRHALRDLLVARLMTATPQESRAACDAVAARLARLWALPRFPAFPGGPPRREAIELLRTAASNVLAEPLAGWPPF